MSKDNKDFFKSKNSWSEIKDKLLGCYLTPYFQKVLMTGKPIFYVDCFAGKGKFDDGKPGSPIIALQERNECLNRTSLPIENAHIDICFIELNYAKELSTNIASFINGCGQTTVVSGKYEERIEDLLSNKQGANVFLYIDPYGIRALDSSMFNMFRNQGFNTIEMLINFNSFGFFRDACRAMKVDYRNDEALENLDDLVEYDPTTVNVSKESENLLSSIAGGYYWKGIVKDYNDGKIDGYQAERRFSTEYKRWLQQRFFYVLDMPIRLKRDQRPKYRLIHVCNHKDGCFLMAQNMLKRKDELFLNIQNKGQMSLDFDDSATNTVENDSLSEAQIRKKLIDHVQKHSTEVHATEFLASFVNENGLLCDFKMIYNLLDDMKGNGIIDIVRTPATTPATGKPSAFWEESKTMKVIIRSSRQ